MYISASAPDAPPFSDTTIGCFIRLFFWIAACIIRAIWSEAPPAPAATTISTGLFGSQALAGALASAAASAAIALMMFRMDFFPISVVQTKVAPRLPRPYPLLPLCGVSRDSSSRSLPQLEPDSTWLKQAAATSSCPSRPACACPEWHPSIAKILAHAGTQDQVLAARGSA